MNKLEILSHLRAMGFEPEEMADYGYLIQYEDYGYIYVFDEDEEFFRMVAPKIFEVTDDNRELLLDIINEVNCRLKFAKTTITGNDVFISYEVRLYSDYNIDDVIEHALLVLQFTLFSFFRKINGGEMNIGLEQEQQEEQVM